VVKQPSVPDSDQEFLELLMLARKGDHEAMGTLIDRYRPYLLKIAYDEGDTNLQGKEGDSDMVQGAYVYAIRAFHMFKGQTAQDLKGWLRKILLNQIHGVRDHYHADKRDVSAEIPLGSDSRINDELLPKEDTPSEQLVQREEHQLLERALQSLSELDRAIISMRQKDGFSFVEIARRLKLTEEAVRKRWARAIEVLEEKVNRPDDPNSR
jgi:RNA polymerase sigma-70 factor, ECF subfamily